MAKMPADSIRLDLRDEYLRELTELARASDRLPKVMAALAAAKPLVGTNSIAKAIAPHTDFSSSELRSILISLLNLFHTQTRLKLGSKATIEAVTDNWRRIVKGQDGRESLALWEKSIELVHDALKQMHSEHPLEVAFKSYKVITAHEYELVGMRLITDARPVFDESGDKILQTVVSHVLSLDYHKGDSHRAVQFALDAQDIVELRRLCERAERKAAALKRDLKGAPWPVSVFRESADPASDITGG
jgi:hypothetical protein